MDNTLITEKEILHRVGRKTLPGFGFVGVGKTNAVSGNHRQEAADCDGGCGGQCLSGCKDECITVSK